MPKEGKQRRNFVSNDDPISCSSAPSEVIQKRPPLAKVIEDDEKRKKYAPLSSRISGHNWRKTGEESDSEDEYMDGKTSQRILELSRDQQREEGSNNGEWNVAEDELKDAIDEDVIHDKGFVTVDGPEYSAEQEAVVSAMLKSDEQYSERKSLADIILAKIKEKETAALCPNSQEGELIDALALPPKVVQVYSEIGSILSHYTSGKLPKAFKVIPSLSTWEDILYLTKPHRWTPQATYAATRIFASNFNPKMAQRYFNLVLLDAVRADIAQSGKLNYHHYNSLIKAAYKPSAFFKGIILPLAQKQSKCTLREAAIVASALRRVSVPMHHAAVAIQKLASGEYAPAASIFLREMMNKKYALPHSVIRSLVLDHFGQFRSYQGLEALPVLFHQSLLVFVQKYKDEIIKRDEYLLVLKELMKLHSHPKITREVRRELFGSAAWQEERNGLLHGSDEVTQQMDI